MRFILLLSIVALSFLQCKSDEGLLQDNNNFLPNTPVNIRLNLDLPQYDTLKFPGSSVILEQEGINGIYISNLNNELFNAFDLTDPNHPLQSCSKLTVDGIMAIGTCSDNAVYDLLNGQREDKQGFTLRRYRVIREQNTLFITR